MLHRSFKPAKCKTALRLAVSRIKLLRNKREAQLKHLKRDVAQLLESGQDRTARIRVEHVDREEKTMAAYELIEIYCELIVARLPMIESQKNCPIDLKEAISSIIFASPRCADVPELTEIRKHFTAKYGKEFSSSAAELRPDCGVGRMLVEKLSAKAPDGQTKIKILSAIAEEHNVKWDPNSLDEKDTSPPEDLLNGPSNFEKASKLFVEPRVQAPPNHDDNRPPPNVQAPVKHDARHDVSGNFYDHNTRLSPHAQNFDSAHADAKKFATFGTFHPQAGSSGTGSEERESRHTYSGEGNAFSLGRKNWNMEFKDATAAAQAAAESAELASMAARAAAEFSIQSQVSRQQYSPESHKSSAHGPSDEWSQKYAGSKLQGEHIAKRPVNDAFPERNSLRHDEQIDRTEQDSLPGAAERYYMDDHENTDKSSWSASLKSTRDSIDNNPVVNSSQNTDRYSRKNSSELENSNSLGELSMKKQSSNSRLEIDNEPNDHTKFENVDYIGDVRIRKQSSRASSQNSHSSTFSDDAGQESFVIDEDNIPSNNEKTNSYDNAAMVFDDDGSDGDDYKFDVGNELNGQESSLYFSSPGRKSQANQLENTNAWSPRKNIDELFEKSISQSHSSSELVFSESLRSSTVPSQPHDFVHVTYDDSDGQSSDGEEELEKSKFVGNMDPSMHPREQIVYSKNSELSKSASHELIASSSAEKENAAFNRKPWSPPSPVDLEPMEVHRKADQGKEFYGASDKRFGYGDLPSPKLEKSVSDLSIEDEEQTPPLPDTWKDNELLKESSLGSGSELNFGKLTGGLRNKGLTRPPYTRSPSGNASSVRHASGSTSKIEQYPSSVTARTTISPGARNQGLRNQKVILKQSRELSPRAPVSSSDSDSDDSKEPSQQTISSSRQTHNQKAGTKVNKNSSPRVPITNFVADPSDSEEDLPKQGSLSNARPITGLSRRTKTSSPNASSRSSYLKAKGTSEASSTPNYGAERKSSSTEALRKPLSQTKSSDHWGSSEKRQSVEQEASKPVPESKSYSNEESLKSSTMKHPSGSLPKISTSRSTDISRSSSAETPSTEKASHVHPKLPDYDAISAHFESLRRNR
ncbi:uncharacterized protein LOC132165521 [Corylus avellana]|uniref:uncharacterized protein LOC132165521 n=1 Tax=Corylus avellana TaxID=13451 RepID=UPI00286CB3FE|nr:uncharacterized protein LOC132165521 [Corylus avellana]